MELLTLGIQAVALLWAAGIAWLGIRTMRRALEARRARLEYWRRLLRSSRDAAAAMPPSAEIRWHDGPDDYFLADPTGGGTWVHHEDHE